MISVIYGKPIHDSEANKNIIEQFKSDNITTNSLENDSEDDLNTAEADFYVQHDHYHHGNGPPGPFSFLGPPLPFSPPFPFGGVIGAGFSFIKTFLFG